MFCKFSKTQPLTFVSNLFSLLAPLKLAVMFGSDDPNKTFVIYTSIGIVIGAILGTILGIILGNFSLWLSLFATIGALVGIAIFYYQKSKY